MSNFSLNDLKDKNLKAYRAFLYTERNAEIVQSGEVKPINHDAPHFYLDCDNTLYFVDLDGDGMVWDEETGQWLM